jgi:hypothetical protein
MFELPILRWRLHKLKALYCDDGEAFTPWPLYAENQSEIEYMLYPYDNSLCCEQLVFLNSSHYSEMDYCLMREG